MVLSGYKSSLFGGFNMPDNTFNNLQQLLRIRAEVRARLELLPYSGTPEIKTNKAGQKYLYVRKRVAGKLTSTYVDVFSDDLYSALLRYSRESRDLRKQLRKVEKELAVLGYAEKDLSVQVQINLDFARANMKSNIYDQAILEGVTTTFPQTETVIENGIVSGMTPTDIQKILNLKHAWEFILDKDVISAPTDYYLLCYIARLINEGFFHDGGKIRSVPVTIGGTNYVPPLPIEFDIKEQISNIVQNHNTPIDTAIELCLYCMKTQIFTDGNKRSSVIIANHYLIAHGAGLLVIPEKNVSEFKSLLVHYYENKDTDNITNFMKKLCWRRF